MSRTLVGTLAAMCSVALITAPAAACTQDSDARQRALPGGALQDAGTPPAQMRALMREGKYGQAERYALDWVAPDRIQLENLLGETLLAQGKRDEAAEAFRRSIAAGARDALDARLNAAILDFDSGAIDEALTQFDAFIDVYNGDADLTPEDLTAVGTAVRYLGRRDPQMFRDAVRAYEDAVESNPRYVDAMVQMGRLFLSKYNSREARSIFEEALKLDPDNPEALTGLAAVLDFDHTPGATDALEKALAVNPNLVPARALRARMHVAAERTSEAREEIERALEVNPNSLEALSVLAAVEYLEDDRSAFEEARGRVAALNPVYPGLHATTADMLAKMRRYQGASEMAAEAVRLDSLSWESHGLLGINQLRLGQVDQARASLERAFAGDPFNPWFKNNLDLLDTFGRYRRVETQHFEIYLDEREADLLEPYVARMAEEAFSSLQLKYNYTPPTPIRLEVYPSHADFSVRILGMAGMGALGVAFGSVLAMDSPSARDPGQFNWASTLWHEVAHAFHLGLSKHRVPRWFTEGLAVHEQRDARPGWGHTPDIGFLRALSQDLLYPVSDLNKGFMRPKYPQQVIHSYYQASLVVALIEELHGFGALPAMLRGYADGKSTDELFREILDEPVGQFDGRFDRHLDGRFGAVVEGLPDDESQAVPRSLAEAEAVLQERPADFVARMVYGRLLLEAGRTREAAEHFEEAVSLFPDYAGPEHPLRYLAQIDAQAGRPAQAAARLSALAALNESDLAANMELAQLSTAVGDSVGALAALGRTLWIYPFDADVHRKIAEIGMPLLDRTAAIRARESVVALDPPDRALALYELALTQFQLGGRHVSARANVLQALEIAPSYSDALDLLLRIRESEAEWRERRGEAVEDS